MARGVPRREADHASSVAVGRGSGEERERVGRGRASCRVRRSRVVAVQRERLAAVLGAAPAPLGITAAMIPVMTGAVTSTDDGW